MTNTLNEKDLEFTGNQLPEPDSDSEPCISIPRTEKFLDALSRLTDFLSGSSLNGEQMMTIASFIRELNHEAEHAAFGTGFNAGMLFAQEMEDDKDYVRLDGKYVRM